MDLKKFSEANRVRCEAPAGFNHQLGSWSLSDWMTATLGELGEAANVAKKLNRYRDGIRGNKQSESDLLGSLKREIADTFIYLDLMAQSCGFDLSDAVVETFNHKSAEIGYLSRFVPVAAPMPSLERARRFRRMAQRMAALVIWPEEDEMKRAGGGVLCDHCGLPYSDHPEKDGLKLTCAGELVKL